MDVLDKEIIGFPPARGLLKQQARETRGKCEARRIREQHIQELTDLERLPSGRHESIAR